MMKFRQVFQELRGNADIATLGWARDTPFRPITRSHSVSLFLFSHCSFFCFHSFSLYPSFRHFSFFPRIALFVHFEILLHHHCCFSSAFHPASSHSSDIFSLFFFLVGWCSFVATRMLLFGGGAHGTVA